MANLIGWGIALIVLGLVLTFTDLFGFIAGFPLVWLGGLLLVVGIIMAIAHFMMGRTGTVGGRRTV